MKDIWNKYVWPFLRKWLKRLAVVVLILLVVFALGAITWNNWIEPAVVSTKSEWVKFKAGTSNFKSPWDSKKPIDTKLEAEPVEDPQVQAAKKDIKFLEAETKRIADLEVLAKERFEKETALAKTKKDAEEAEKARKASLPPELPKVPEPAKERGMVEKGWNYLGERIDAFKGKPAPTPATPEVAKPIPSPTPAPTTPPASEETGEQIARRLMEEKFGKQPTPTPSSIPAPIEATQVAPATPPTRKAAAPLVVVPRGTANSPEAKKGVEVYDKDTSFHLSQTVWNGRIANDLGFTFSFEKGEKVVTQMRLQELFIKAARRKNPNYDSLRKTPIVIEEGSSSNPQDGSWQTRHQDPETGYEAQFRRMFGPR